MYAQLILKDHISSKKGDLILTGKNYICYMSKGKAWVIAMRLRTLPLSLAGIIMGTAVAYYGGFWDPLIFAFAVATTILFQIVLFLLLLNSSLIRLIFHFDVHYIY